jgi:hypothetical protein
LEEDLSESGRGENEIPRALFLVLKSLRVFGHVDFSVFVELMKDIQVKAGYKYLLAYLNIKKLPISKVCTIIH